MNNGNINATNRANLIEVERKAANHLAHGNECSERGDKAKAEKYYAKSQFWLDLMNKLLGNS